MTQLEQITLTAGDKSVDMPVLQQPEAYVGGAGDLFDESGGLKKPETRQFLDKFLAAFAAWIGKTAKVPA